MLTKETACFKISGTYIIPIVFGTCGAFIASCIHDVVFTFNPANFRFHTKNLLMISFKFISELKSPMAAK